MAPMSNTPMMSTARLTPPPRLQKFNTSVLNIQSSKSISVPVVRNWAHGDRHAPVNCNRSEAKGRHVDAGALKCSSVATRDITLLSNLNKRDDTAEERAKVPGPGEGGEGRDGDGQGADEEVSHRHVADVHVGPRLECTAPVIEKTKTRGGSNSTLSYLRTVKMTIMFPPDPMIIIRP